MGYRKKRKTVLYPMVSTAAIKIPHGDLRGTAAGRRDGLGFLPLRLGYFPEVGKLDCFGKCSNTTTRDQNGVDALVAETPTINEPSSTQL
jgi:hypothetical protein